MIHLFVINKTKYRINSSTFRAVFKVAQEILRFYIDELSVAVVGKQEIQAINLAYRKKNAPTDVLSFDYGEIVLCPSYIIEKHSIYRGDVDKKMVELFVHGLAHIAGYSHRTKAEEKRMKTVEARILSLNKLNIKNQKSK